MRYAGRVTALDAVSFEARPGEVLGFLGPNGAGKTTAMRICTGFLAPTAGSVSVCGIDVAADPLAARARLGYLPSRCRSTRRCASRSTSPIAPRSRASRAQSVAARASTKRSPPSRSRPSGGASSASCPRATASASASPTRSCIAPTCSSSTSRPTASIPTSAATRSRSSPRLGKERTVILSTHILPEVESVCARVVILDRGRVIAEGRPAELVDAERDLRLVARPTGASGRDAILAAVRAVDGVTEISALDGDAFRIKSARDVREAVARAVLAVAELRELRPSALGLERVFAELTVRA